MTEPIITRVLTRYPATTAWLVVCAGLWIAWLVMTLIWIM